MLSASHLFLVFLGGVNALPSQIHLSLGGKPLDNTNVPSGMYVSWFEDSVEDGKIVKYGTTSDLNGQVTSTSTNYLKDHGYHHVALIEDLPCDMDLVYYEIEGDTTVRSFHRAPCSSPSSFTVSIFGDFGYLDSVQRPVKLKHRDGSPFDGLEPDWSAQYSRDSLERMKEDLDFMWIVGDIGYVDDSFASNPLKFTYEEVYNNWMGWMQNITAAIPLMVSPGNHESECHSPICVSREFKYGRHLTNFTAFTHRWNMPSEESGGNSNMWYSWNYGAAHFVSINTETDWDGAEEEGTGDSHIPWMKAGGFGEDGEFLRWLEADLKAAAEAKAKGEISWIIVGGHRPYNTIQTMPGVEGWFKEYGVDMYFAGHSHSYSRTLDIDSSPMYIVAGGAGCDEMGPSKDSLLLGPVGSDLIESDRYSTGVLTVSDSKLKWKLIDSIDGSTIDEVEITK